MWRLSKSARRGYNRADEAALLPCYRQLAHHGSGAAGRLCCGHGRLAGDAPAAAASLPGRKPVERRAAPGTGGCAADRHGRRVDRLAGGRRIAGPAWPAAGGHGSLRGGGLLADGHGAVEHRLAPAALPAAAGRAGHRDAGAIAGVLPGPRHQRAGRRRSAVRAGGAQPVARAGADSLAGRGPARTTSGFSRTTPAGHASRITFHVSRFTCHSPCPPHGRRLCPVHERGDRGAPQHLRHLRLRPGHPQPGAGHHRAPRLSPGDAVRPGGSQPVRRPFRAHLLPADAAGPAVRRRARPAGGADAAAGLGRCAGLPAGAQQAGQGGAGRDAGRGLPALPGPARRQHLRLPRDRAGGAAVAVEPVLPGDRPLPAVRSLPGPRAVHQRRGRADRRRHRPVHPAGAPRAAPRRAGHGAVGAVLRVGNGAAHARAGRRRGRGTLRGSGRRRLRRLCRRPHDPLHQPRLHLQLRLSRSRQAALPGAVVAAAAGHPAAGRRRPLDRGPARLCHAAALIVPAAVPAGHALLGYRHPVALLSGCAGAGPGGAAPSRGGPAAGRGAVDSQPRDELAVWLAGRQAVPRHPPADRAPAHRCGVDRRHPARRLGQHLEPLRAAPGQPRAGLPLSHRQRRRLHFVRHGPGRRLLPADQPRSARRGHRAAAALGRRRRIRPGGRAGRRAVAATGRGHGQQPGGAESAGQRHLRRGGAGRRAHRADGG